MYTASTVQDTRESAEAAAAGAAFVSPSDPLLRRLVDEGLVDMRDDTSPGDGRFDQRIQLFVTADGELQVSRGDTLHLEVLACITRQLQHLRSQVLQDRRGVDGRRGTDSLV